jgi:hypothetical protein
VGRCPECSSQLDITLDEDRRSHKHIEPIRDWITGLRISGADFTRDAAIAAREAAWNARRSGGSLEDAFQMARTAYYGALRESESV